MEKKIRITLLLFLILFMSCISKTERNTYQIEISNPDLRNEIIKYINQIAASGKDDFQFEVFCMDVNDSTSRYVVNAFKDPELIKMFPFQFVADIDRREVYFIMLAAIDKRNFGKNNFFRIKDGSYKRLLKTRFPTEYKDMIANKKKSVYEIYEPQMLYLTFRNNKLIKREMRKGVPWI